MRTLGIVDRFLIAFFLLSGVAGDLQAQQGQPTKPVEPVEGQPGRDVIWVGTEQALLEKMLDMAKVTKQDYVIDLGSGDGRTVIAAAKRGARALGIEYNPDLVALSKVNAAKEGVSDKAKFMQADLFATDFSHATVIAMFLLPTINMKLRPTLLEMKPGTRIVSNTFDMGDWAPDATSTVENCAEAYEDSNFCTALLWIVPAKVEGTWQLDGGELTLTQKFQELTGNRMKGTSTSSGQRASWSMTRR